jgi:general L-amino acid transport system permease protein
MSLPLPPSTHLSPWQWLRQNLFNTGWNTVLSLVSFWLILQGGIGAIRWATTQAQWAVVTTNWRLFWIGRYPPSESWRLGVALAIALSLIGLWISQRLIKPEALKTKVTWAIYGLVPIEIALIGWLLAGGLGLASVGTHLWGGLMLTLIVAIVSIGLAFPLGVLLALGRQSDLPVLQGFCTAYIELIRGLPLIGILFMAQVMLPLVLPGQPNIDRVVRAIAGLVLFNAAYLAETVRGGLQSIPRGQTEAAQALGLNPLLTLRLIVLPQALRIAIPGIVGQFISLFKDTSLLSLFALVELTGIGRSILAQPQFLGRYAEVYLLIGFLYWIFCYTLSISSRWLERKLLV